MPASNPFSSLALDKPSRDVATLVDQGDFATAAWELGKLNMLQSLALCDKLNAQQRAELFKKCGADSRFQRQRFALGVVADREMPARPTEGFTQVSQRDGDLHVARMYILWKLMQRKDPDWKKKRPFYPEFSGIKDRRERLCQIALAHKDLGPDDQMQATFFSLNGLFGWDAVSTRVHTTCGLFVRASLIAAGYRGGISEKPSGSGISEYVAWTHNKLSYVHYPDAKHPYPKRGDIFHINQPKTNRDHVGIILNLVCVDADDDAWTIETVEGGQQEFWTRHFASKSMIKSGPNRVFSGGDRPLQGWVDIDKYGSWVDF
jgi:hypothetical protein